MNKARGKASFVLNQLNASSRLSFITPIKAPAKTKASAMEADAAARDGESPDFMRSATKAAKAASAIAFFILVPL